MTNKKKILVIWWYDRDDLLDIFNRMSDDLDITFIFYKFKSDETKQIPFKTCYWTDYNSPYALLDKVRPDKVVFMGIGNNHVIALNIAAKHLKIPTYYLQHGLLGTLENAIKAEKSTSIEDYYDNEKKLTQKYNKKYHSVFFLLSSIRINNIFLFINFLKLIFYKRNLTASQALKKAQFVQRNSDYYLMFSEKQANYFIERDGIKPNQVKKIGNPFFDTYFLKNDCHKDEEKYFLLIDTPYWNGIRSKRYGLNYEDRDNFYNNLLLYSKSKGCKLIIKLHPLDYNLKNFQKDENLVYLRDYKDMKCLMKKSKGIFGCFSTLMFPALCLNDVILFKVGKNSYFQERIEDLGVANVLDIKKFSLDDIQFTKKNNLHEFIDEYLYKIDGNSIDRLMKILES